MTCTTIPSTLSACFGTRAFCPIHRKSLTPVKRFHPHNHMSGALNQVQINAGLSGVLTVGTTSPVQGADVQHLLLRSTFVRPNGTILYEADPLFCDSVPEAKRTRGIAPASRMKPISEEAKSSLRSTAKFTRRFKSPLWVGRCGALRKALLQLHWS